MASSSTFSGSAVSATGTLNDFVNRIQVFLNDEGDATWDTEMIATFLNDAIRDYSQHFPRIKTQTINMADDDNDYPLAADFLGVLSVEYPVGEDPPEYLVRKNYTDPGFWDCDDYYDIIHNTDDANPDDIWISADPSSGETALVTYHAYHQLIADPTTPTETNTVRETHQHLLVLNVQWKASIHLMNAEQQSPTSNSSLLMAQLAQNARRNELSYHTALQQAIYADEGRSRHINWTEQNPAVQRIY